MGIFGWDLPPGCTMRDIENAFGAEEPCATCGEFVDACICPACPVCGEVGDLGCYAVHGLQFTEAQLAGIRRREEENAKAIADDMAAAEDEALAYRLASMTTPFDGREAP